MDAHAGIPTLSLLERVATQLAFVKNLPPQPLTQVLELASAQCKDEMKGIKSKAVQLMTFNVSLLQLTT
eukprot:m.81071 g.81071  ORF g.81071 m.81071 type:complete len:69 (-) comp12622_c1_seq2:897-1103(-)